MESSAQFMDLITACAQFVTTVGRIVPDLRGATTATPVGVTSGADRPRSTAWAHASP
jgi:hypothetical protein